MNVVSTAAGDRITFDRYGPAGSPGVLFISGAGPTRADDPTTTRSAELLGERGIQASVHDRVGRGDSAADGPIDLERELLAIEALTQELGGPVVLTGHSSGCAIAMLAASRVEACAGLVLWEAPIGQFDGGAPRVVGRCRDARRQRSPGGGRRGLHGRHAAGMAGGAAALA